MEAEAALDKPPTFEEYQQSKSYMLQQELLNLIKTKIGSSDKDKVQKFYSKMQSQLKNTDQTQYIADLTLKKIQSLILEQKSLDDKKLYDESIKQKGYTLGQRVISNSNATDYYPLRFDAGDSSKLAPMTKNDYEEFVTTRYEQLTKEIALDEVPKKLMGG